ncbi:hypothetical protein Q7Y45_08715 [Glaesserella parasuis]|nr:hypothetical protein [Glaesserella parasuis]
MFIRIGINSIIPPISIIYRFKNKFYFEFYHSPVYPNDIGPGVYDIHSPRVPKAEEIEHLLRKALKVVPKERLWVNPDCGLKTRDWKETIEQLQVMVEVTKKLRTELA